ncbi:MAG: hypothetical protein IT325_03880, partial [Anaerolineae bacterium]|nr:hypothetical protein [Anaerolineae bacterium]
RSTDSFLELDGKIVLDNALLEGDPVVEPEMVFWHRYELGSGAAAYAEISLDNRQTWTRLTGSYLASAATNRAYTQVVIPLDAFVGQSFHFRFRLTVSSSATMLDGWYIDDFALRNRYNGLIYLNWCDNIESGGGSWLPMGQWAVVDGADYNSGQDQSTIARSGSRFFSDSPGSNYGDLTNSILQLVPRLNLVSATRPELTFWHQWDIDRDEKLNVEVSTNLGQTWTTIWTKTRNVRPPGYGSSTVPSSGYDHIRSWTREAVDLSAYTGSELMLRFRLDALTNALIDDGWWLDDICVQEYTEPVYSLPFTEGFESANSRWYWGGSWARISTDQRTGGASAHDSPDGDYQHESNGILELRGAIDLTGTVKPTLYIWERLALADSDDATLVEVKASADGGQTWSNWEQLNRLNGTGSTTTSWNRRQIGTTASLESYAGKLVKLRFRLYAERTSTVADGWYIDDIAVIERDGAEPIFTLPFFDDAESDNDNWVFDGTWGRVPAARTLSTTGLGPGGWTGEYFRDTNWNRQFDAGEYRGTRTDAAINFDWGSGGPGSAVGLSGVNDGYLVRWTRTINVLDDGTVYEIQTRSDDGIRVLIDGATVIDAWVDRSYNDSTPDTTMVTLSAGTHDIVVEYYESGGSARVRVDFGLATQVYHDSPAGNYDHQNNMAMTLEGMIDLRGASAPYLSFWYKRLLGSSDYGRVEVSTDQGYSWTEVTNTSGASTTWAQSYVNLSAYAGQLVNIRFRLDARYNAGVGDGWYIDDIQVYDS